MDRDEYGLSDAEKQVWRAPFDPFGPEGDPVDILADALVHVLAMAMQARWREFHWNRCHVDCNDKGHNWHTDDEWLAEARRHLEGKP